MSSIPIIVVYKKPRGKKHYLKVLFGNIDDIIDGNKRKPPIAHEYEIIKIGWGKSFIEKYKEEYKIKEIDKDE